MITISDEAWATDTLRDAQDTGAGTIELKPIARITLERMNLVFDQRNSRGYASEGQPEHDAATVLENSLATLFKVVLESGVLKLTKWSVAAGLVIDNVTVVADADLSNRARPSIELTAGNPCSVRIFYVDENDDFIHYVDSGDGGASFGAEADVGSLTKVKAIASVSPSKIHCISYSNGNTRFHCYEDEGGWSIISSLLYWPHSVEHIDAITVGDRDLIIFYSPGPIYDRFLEAGIYGVWYKHGRWGDLFKIDALDESDGYSYRKDPMISQANDIYFLIGYLSEGDSDYSHTIRFLKTSKDGQHWSQYQPLVTCPEAGPAKLLMIDVASGQLWPWDEGKQAYLIGFDKVYESDATRLVGEENTALQVDVTDRVLDWSLTQGVIASGNTVLGNHDGFLDDHSIINANNLLLLKREAGYNTEIGDEYAQLALEQVDVIKETDRLPRRHKQIKSRNFMASMRDGKADHFEERKSQLIGYDNYHDDVETGHGSLSHTATQKGWWKTDQHQLWLVSDNEEGIAFGTWDSRIMNGQHKAMIRIETSGNNEYAGVVFRAHDKDNFLCAYYDQATDKILLRQKYNGAWKATLASSAALGWSEDVWYGVMVDFRYSYIRVFHSADGNVWTLAFIHIINYGASGNPPEYGYVGVIGYGYSDQDQDQVPGYDPPLPPPGPTPDDLGPIGPAVAGHSEDGYYVTGLMGDSWEERNTGLPGTDVLSLIWDPFWFTSERQGTNDPDQVIVWACGEGWIAKKVGPADWEDVTPTTNPQNAWGDAVAPTASTVIYKQLHGDMHHLDTFYVLVEWQEVGGDWRGWIAKTIDNGFSWTWQPLGSFLYKDGYYYASDWSLLTAHQFEYDTWLECIDKTLGYGSEDEGLALDGNSNTYGQFFRGETFAQPGYIIVRLHFGTGFQRVSNKIELELRFHLSAPDSNTLATECKVFRDDDPGGQPTGSQYVIPGTDPVDWTGPGPAIERTITFDNNFDISEWVGMSVLGTSLDTCVYLCYARIHETYQIGTLDQSRPLAMDLDSESGDLIYITVWHEGTLYCDVYDGDLSFVRRTAFGSATEAQVADKTYFIVPRTPYVPSEPDFGDYVYIFGRYNDGAEKHLAYSSDAGVSFSNVGSVSWDSNHRIGALDVLSDNLTIYAFINHVATPRLWKTVDRSAWSNINSVPFNVEFDALSRCTWTEEEEFLIGSNAAGATMAAWLPLPYTNSWGDATGDPSLPTASGYISSIIWV